MKKVKRKVKRPAVICPPGYLPCYWCKGRGQEIVTCSTCRGNGHLGVRKP